MVVFLCNILDWFIQYNFSKIRLKLLAMAGMPFCIMAVLEAVAGSMTSPTSVPQQKVKYITHG